jgi:hypothetical protein
MSIAPQAPARNEDAVVPRQCGRCRLEFDGDPTVVPGTKPGWWLCPPCHTALLGGADHRHAAGTTPEVVR